MSKGVRRGRHSDTNIFDTSNRVTSQETADAIFSPDVLSISDQRQVARPVSIFEIQPDYSQPRRAIPWAVRRYWNSQPDTLDRMFSKWIEIISDMRGNQFDLHPYLAESFLLYDDRGNIIEFDDGSEPLEKSLLEIVRLAADIRRNGLTNPITLEHSGRGYRLETGERRWLAYHLLHIHFPDENWAKIPAREVDHVDVWRQAGENNARANLNAISKARQLAILLMDILHGRGSEFQTYSEIVKSGRSEREYYAQVADGDQFRIPRGTGEKLLDAMGLKNPVQLRQYRALLRLSDEQWEHADDYDLSEGEIRELSEQDASPNADTVTRVTVSPANDPGYNPFVEQANKKRHHKVWSYAARIEMLSTKDKKDALATIAEHKRWLEELERAILDRDK